MNTLGQSRYRGWAQAGRLMHTSSNVIPFLLCVKVWKLRLYLKQQTLRTVIQVFSQSQYGKGDTGWSQRRHKREQDRGKKKGLWVLIVDTSTGSVFGFGVWRQVSPFGCSTSGIVQMKASTHHQHTEHNGPEAALSSPETSRQTSNCVQVHLL